MERKEGGGARESGDAREMGGASVPKNVTAAERGMVRGVYSATCLGPREDEREAYVVARDRLIGARARVSAYAGVVGRERRRLASSGRLRKLATAMMVAIGLASAATPVLARAEAELVVARVEAARHELTLSAFVLERKWEEPAFENLVTTVGKNHVLDTELAGSSYSVTGPYLFLIGSGASGAVIGDTMASHAGWTEVGATNDPHYTSPRKTLSFSAASSGSKTTSAAASFAITSAGTVGGCGLVLGTGAVSTIDNTSGTLLSAGAFTGGSKTVANGDTLNVTYTLSL